MRNWEDYIDVNIVQNQGAEKLTTIFTKFVSFLGDPETKYTTQNLGKKIISDFEGKHIFYWE